MNKKRMKKTVIVFSIIISIIAIFICFIVIYNEVAKPFEHKTYYSGKEKNCDEIMKMPFYEEYVKNKYDEYDCMVFSRHGKDCILPQITLPFNHFTLHSYWVTIFIGENFSDVNDENLLNLVFVKTPIGYKESLHYIDCIEIGDWVFKEMKYAYEWYEENEMMQYYYDNYRKTSYWYGYNKSTKQISFSILEHYDNDYYYDDVDVIEYFKKNFPI